MCIGLHNRVGDEMRTAYKTITPYVDTDRWTLTSKVGVRRSAMMQLQELERKRSTDNPVNWVTAFFMAAFHVGAIAALKVVGLANPDTTVRTHGVGRKEILADRETRPVVSRKR